MTMQSAVKKILVVGGNGFIGSAVCKAAVARGIEVTSVSSSGRPYRTAKGHTPAWTAKVDWRQGDALEPQGFAELFPEVDGVVHTLGTLFENSSYKQAVRGSNLAALIGNMLGSANPLENTGPSYELLNRDSALRVCEAFLASEYRANRANEPRPFIYVSAEDIFRPVVPARYIETKREAERRIAEMLASDPAYRAVFIRPGLVYHAHQRPLTTPPAVLLDISAGLHRSIPRGLPTPSSILRALGGRQSSLGSIANALETPPIHVDQVADAICTALDSANDVRGVVDVERMRNRKTSESY